MPCDIEGHLGTYQYEKRLQVIWSLFKSVLICYKMIWRNWRTILRTRYISHLSSSTLPIRFYLFKIPLCVCFCVFLLLKTREWRIYIFLRGTSAKKCSRIFHSLWSVYTITRPDFVCLRFVLFLFSSDWMLVCILSSLMNNLPRNQFMWTFWEPIQTLDFVINTYKAQCSTLLNPTQDPNVDVICC
jgi:hypothetical protein